MGAQLTCLEVYCIFKLEHGSKLRCSVHLQPLGSTPWADVVCVQVGVSDISLKGRLRTTLIPLLFQMPVIGAVQVSCCHQCKTIAWHALAWQALMQQCAWLIKCTYCCRVGQSSVRLSPRMFCCSSAHHSTYLPPIYGKHCHATLPSHNMV